MAKKRKPIKDKKDTRKEYYEGYYWLILHTDPFHAPGGCRGDGGCIIISDYWKTEMPDCVKTVAEKHIISQHRALPALLSAIIESDLEGRGKYFPGRNNIYSTDPIFDWFARMDIPRLTVEDTKIMGWRDLRKLWRKINIVDSYGKETPLTEANWFKKAKDSEPLYQDHGEDIFYALESYLEPQHKKNLKELETPGAGGEGKDAETPAYQWEIKGQEVSCNGSRPIKLEDRMSKIFKYLHDRRGKPVKIQSLEKEVGLTREGIRDAMIDLKNLLPRELGIDRNQMDKIIEAVKDRKNKNEITAYVFH